MKKVSLFCLLVAVAGTASAETRQSIGTLSIPKVSDGAPCNAVVTTVQCGGTEQPVCCGVEGKTGSMITTTACDGVTVSSTSCTYDGENGGNGAPGAGVCDGIPAADLSKAVKHTVREYVMFNVSSNTRGKIQETITKCNDAVVVMEKPDECFEVVQTAENANDPCGNGARLECTSQETTPQTYQICKNPEGENVKSLGAALKGKMGSGDFTYAYVAPTSDKAGYIGTFVGSKLVGESPDKCEPFIQAGTGGNDDTLKQKCVVQTIPSGVTNDTGYVAAQEYYIGTGQGVGYATKTLVAEKASQSSLDALTGIVGADANSGLRAAVAANTTGLATKIGADYLATSAGQAAVVAAGTGQFAALDANGRISTGALPEKALTKDNIAAEMETGGALEGVMKASDFATEFGKALGTCSEEAETAECSGLMGSILTELTKAGVAKAAN